MSDSTEIYIRRTLKNWAAEQQPPENLRARLMLIAASGQHDQFSQSQAQQSKSSKIDIVIPNLAPLDQAIQFHNLPWLWVGQVSLNSGRQIT